jgi:hypothetical protein
MTENATQWFVVLPGAQPKGETITLPLMYIGIVSLNTAIR